MLKWEEEFNRRFSIAQWSKALYYAYHASACANHREQYQKLLTRWYFNPLRLAKAYDSASPLCWRSCGSVGSLLHIFWSCPVLQPFWAAVLALITSLTGRRCPEAPWLALLLVSIDDFSPHRLLISNILHAARLVIARQWKETAPPTMSEAREVVSNVFLHEQTLAWYRGSTTSFNKAWAPWRAMFPNTT